MNSGTAETNNEVKVIPGVCVAWRCNEPADGLACVKHAEDFAPFEERPCRLTAEDFAELAQLPAEQREKRRKLLTQRRAREDPEYRDRQNRLRREKAGAQRVAEGFSAHDNRATARRQRRHDAILAELREHGSVLTTVLAQKHGVGPERIGEDLRHLADNGLAVKVYGGAKLAA
jgi:hypothetical protein